MPSSWTITSSDDANYARGQSSESCFRKTKLNGHAQLDWVGSDHEQAYTHEHWSYLRLPDSLQPGATYTLTVDGATNGSAGGTEAIRSSAGYLRTGTDCAARTRRWLCPSGGSGITRRRAVRRAPSRTRPSPVRPRPGRVLRRRRDRPPSHRSGASARRRRRAGCVPPEVRVSDAPDRG